jgi:hypothetical protein
MNEPSYELTVLKEAHRFDFVSTGPINIIKSIVYFKTQDPYLVTLTLGNVLPDAKLDVLTVNDNGDRDKILATVVRSIGIFLNIHPDHTVMFAGNTPARTRLYKMVISKELPRLADCYLVHGITESSIEVFNSGANYIGFLISIKKPIIA